MADPDQSISPAISESGLSQATRTSVPLYNIPVTDITKMNLNFMTPERSKAQEEVVQAQQDLIKQLQDRYSNPNWFRIAAGFAKPQLGGFLASLGSAAQEYGQQVENQRAMAPTIANMRSELAMKQAQLSTAKQAADILQNPEGAGGTLSPRQQGQYAALIGGNYGEAAQNALNSKLQNMIRALESSYNMGNPKSKESIDAMLNAVGVTSNDVMTATGKDPYAYASGTSKGSAPPVSAPSLHTTPASAEPAMSTLKNGARVDDIGRRLDSLGVPIISQYRTQEEQNALKDHQDANGNWLTKNNLPVAEHSQHLSGSGIDVDTNQMTGAAERLLESEGWHRPIPQKDPGHWELANPSASKGKTQEGPIATSFVIGDYSGLDRNTAESLRQRDLETSKAKDDSIASLHKQWNSTVNSPDYQQGNNDYRNVLEILNNPEYKDTVNRVMNYMRQNGDVKNQIANALNAGIKGHLGELGAGISLPIDQWISAGFNPKQQLVADMLAKSLTRIAGLKASAQGYAPEKGQKAYMDVVDNAMANMLQNPATAANIVASDYIDWQAMGKKVQAMNEGLGKTSPTSFTKFSDVAQNYQPYKDVETWAELAHEKQRKAYQKLLSNTKG